MVSKAQKFRLGLFIFISTMLLAIFLISVAGNSLMEKRDNYFINYKNVSVNGLQVGSQVKYYGINIGRVEEISIDLQDVENVIVEISLKERTPIKEDVYATLIPVGITGLVQIELTGGTNEAKLLKPGDMITPGTSLFQSITGKAEAIAEKMEILLNNLVVISSKKNQEKVNNIIKNVDTIISENKRSVDNIVTNVDSTFVYISELTISLQTTLNKINTFLDSEKIDSFITNAEKISSNMAEIDLAKLVDEINSSVDQANRTFRHIDGTFLTSREDIITTIETLKETIDYLNDFARQVSENPTVLWKTSTQ